MAGQIPEGAAAFQMQFLNPATFDGIAMVTWAVLLPDGSVVSDIGDLMSDQKVAFESNWQRFVPSDQTFGPLVGTFNFGDGLIVAEQGSTTEGTGDGPYHPSNTAYLIQKRSTSGGRRNRGRLYFPYVETEVGRILTDEQHDDVQDAASGWFASMIEGDLAGGTIPCILHTEGAETPTPVATLTVSFELATQRTRMRD